MDDRLYICNGTWMDVIYSIANASREGAGGKDHRVGDVLALFLAAEQLDERERERESGPWPAAVVQTAQSVSAIRGGGLASMRRVPRNKLP